MEVKVKGRVMAAQVKCMYDVIVVGAGVEGSAIAYTLAKRGQKVLLIEKFPLPHCRGSSHGQSRITRYTYEEDHFVRMMLDAFPLWSELEKEVGEQLFVNCGVVDFKAENSKGLQATVDLFEKYGIPYEKFSNQEMSKKYPAVRLPSKIGGFLDPSGGLLRADRCVRAFQTIFKSHGGVIRDGEPVTSITPGKTVTVRTNKGLYTGASVVLASGAWTKPLALSLGLNLPLKATRTTVLYWKIKPGHLTEHQVGQLPCFIDYSLLASGSFHVYGMPESEYPGLVKSALHEGMDCDPDSRDQVDDSGIVNEVVKTIQSKLPYLETTPAIREYCMYTMTPDEQPFVGQHPSYNNVVIAAGFCGSGFKLAPAIGKVVSQMILEENICYNMDPFKLDRFVTKSHL